MKILYIPSLNNGVIYWRIENYATNLLKIDDTRVYVDYFFDPKDGIAWEAFDTDTREGMMIESKLDAAFEYFDVIIFQKIQHKPGLKLMMRLKEKYPKTKIYCEVDDHIGDITPSNINADKFKDHHTMAAHHCQISDGIITSTSYLAEFCKVFNENVFVAPNCIDPTTWSIEEKKNPKNDKFTYGYVSGGGHDEDLKILQNGLNNFQRDCVIKIRYGGFRPDFLIDRRIDFKTVAWNIEEYPQKLYDMNIDCALAPLRDTEFNRCKSNLKWIEWSSLGIPLIASNVEPYKNTNGPIILRNNRSFDLVIRENKIDFKELKTANKENYSIVKNCKKLLLWLKEHQK
jgi:hypothetical protein|tara:strand:+ start:4669 stop:5700 length:1032 start_codon:yes stop_codon:yes gene_type:complete